MVLIRSRLKGHPRGCRRLRRNFSPRWVTRVRQRGRCPSGTSPRISGVTDSHSAACVPSGGIFLHRQPASGGAAVVLDVDAGRGIRQPMQFQQSTQPRARTKTHCPSPWCSTTHLPTAWRTMMASSTAGTWSKAKRRDTSRQYPRSRQVDANQALRGDVPSAAADVPECPLVSSSQSFVPVMPGMSMSG